jgi:hypothetical protein
MDPDFQGYVVWMSEETGFTPSADNEAWKGYTDGHIRFPLGAGTYYFKYAAYDAFTADPNLINVSPEDSITISPADIDPQMIVDSAIIGTAQIDEIDASLIASGELNVDRIAAASLRADHVVFGSRDNVIYDPVFDHGTLNYVYTQVDQGGPGNGVWSIESSLAYTGPHCARFEYGGNETQDSILSFNTSTQTSHLGHVQAREGQKFYFEFYTRSVGAMSANRVSAMLQFWDQDGSYLTSASGTKVGISPSWTRCYVVGTASASSYYVTFVASIEAGEAAGIAALVDGAYARTMVGTPIVEDEAISSSNFVYSAGPTQVSGYNVWRNLAGLWATGAAHHHVKFWGLVDAFWGVAYIDMRILRDGGVVAEQLKYLERYDDPFSTIPIYTPVTLSWTDHLGGYYQWQIRHPYSFPWGVDLKHYGGLGLALRK